MLTLIVVVGGVAGLCFFGNIFNSYGETTQYLTRMKKYADPFKSHVRPEAKKNEFENFTFSAGFRLPLFHQKNEEELSKAGIPLRGEEFRHKYSHLFGRGALV